MTIKQLHYFIAVAEAKSFTNAARSYFIAQTAMSQQISALEKELGFRLFHRTNRTVELTDAGAVLLQRLRPLILDLENAFESASATAGVGNQAFRIGISDQAVNRFLSPALHCFVEQFPHALPLLIADDHHLLLEALAEGRLDAAVLGNQYYTPRSIFTTRTLFSYRVMEAVLAVPKDSPLGQDRRPLPWSALDGQRFIAYSPLRENQQGDELRQILSRYGLHGDIVCSTRSVETALIYVAAGMGCCLLPAFAGEHQNRETRMVPMESDLQDTMLLIWHKESENPLTPEFLSCCRRTLHGT